MKPCARRRARPRGATFLQGWSLASATAPRNLTAVTTTGETFPAKDLADYQKDPGTPLPLTLDESGRLFRAFGVHEVPTVVLLDARGRIAAKLGPNDRGLAAALRVLEPGKATS